MATSLIPPPSGFELDEDEAPQPPQGFELDVDTETPAPPSGFELDADEPSAVPEGIPLTSFPTPPLGSPGNMPFSPTGDIPGRPDTALTEALFTQLPTDIGNVARAIPADLAAGLSLLKRPEGQEVGALPSFGAIKSAVQKNLPAAAEASGNIPAAVMQRPLPIDAALAASAEESVQRGEPLVAETLGQTSQGLAATAPLLVGIGILPKAAQAFASAGFSLDMIRHAPALFKDYAEEINKPKAEQNPDRLAQLQSGIIQTFAFAPLAGAHAGRGLKERLQTARKVATELPIDFEVVPKSEPLPPTQELQNALVKETEQAVPGVRPRNEVQEVPVEISRSAVDERGNQPAQAEAVSLTPQEQAAIKAETDFGFFDRQSEAQGMGRQSGAPTVEDIRAQRASEAREAQTATKADDTIARQVEQETGFKLVKKDQAAAADISTEAMARYTPEERAMVEQIIKKYPPEWEFTDNRPGSPTAGRTFRAPIGATKAEIVESYKKAVPEKASQNAPKEATGATLAPSSPQSVASELNLKYDGDVMNRQQFTIQDAGPARLAQFTVPKGATKAQIQEKLSATKARFEEVEGAEPVGARSYFDPQSEALGMGRQSTRPSVEDVRRSREAGSPPPVEPPSKATPGTLSESERMRKLSERATASEKIPEPVQEQIKGSPESYYQQQSLSKVEERVREMSDADLGSVPKESDIYTAAKLEQATRLFDSGNSEAGYRVFQDLSTELTRLGQVINQAKLFQALRPEHVVTVLNKELTKAGKDPLTPDQSRRVEGVAAERIKKQADLQKSTKEWTKDPTDANAVKAEKALEDANKAALDEQTLVNQFKPRSTPSIIKSILQGNLLVPMSHVANLVGNINFSPFRAGVRTIASGIDVLDSYLRNRPRQVSVSPGSGGKASVEGLIKGVKQIPSILTRGSGETIKGESRAGLHPLRAWVKQFAKNPDIPTVDGRIPLSERVNLAIEGTFGVPAEVMLRGLGAGDIAFSEMARSRLISEQSRLQKLTPDQTRMAKNFPELFFDKAALDKINNETRGAVFQRHSKTLDHLLSWIKGRGDLFDLALAFVAPYKLTPWNIVGEILSYNPLIAMGRTALEAKRGNIRAAEMNAAKVVVGSTLVYAGYWLYEKGLLSPSMDSKDEQQKARILAGEVMPPNHVNISGLKRAMSGGDPAFKAGDETVDIFRGGGLAGSMFYMMANVGRDAETKPEAEQAILSLLKNSTLEQARFGLNQSFLKGVTGLLDAVRDGDADTYAQSLASTVLSVPLPNTLSAISRAQREYKVDAYEKNLAKQVENVVRTRLGFAGMDDYLPLKRGLWGEPLRETPESRNALVYHFFDISKNRQVTSDPVPLELYRLWRKTANTSVIPTPPDKTITRNRQTYLLNPEQRSRYAELVGAARRNIAERLVTNPEWYKIPDEGKIKRLDSAYRRGDDIGKAQFLREFGDDLEKKPAKAGFGK